jgi:hypothetical protein
MFIEITDVEHDKVIINTTYMQGVSAISEALEEGMVGESNLRLAFALRDEAELEVTVTRDTYKRLRELLSVIV